MPDAAPTLIVASDDSERVEAPFLALSRAIRRANGFTLLIAVCNEPKRQEQLIERLDRMLATPTLRIVIPDDCRDVLPVVESLLANESAPSAVMVTGLATGICSVAPSHARLRSLNHRREEWRERVQAPVVFWLPEYLLQPLAQQAPDFLDWRSGTFMFLDQLGRLTAFDLGAHGHSPEVWRLPESERRQRMSQLREWLAAFPSPRDSLPDPAAIRWRLELAEHHRQLGELDECMRIAREEVLGVLPPADDPNRAIAWGLIADVLYARGEWNEALSIRRKGQLPVYERLGDDRSRAITLGQIADILQSQGKLDQSLRIRLEEELPVYERLGDIRSKAVTLGCIADILEARGRLDEALHIRLKEELPVYERLGDDRSRAITLGQIADVFQARGELDEAIRIRRDQQLPIFERFGDIHSKTVTLGRIADAMQARGELDEAFRIRRNQELPVYERLGDVQAKTITLAKIADLLEARGDLDEAVRILQEQLPVLEKLGDVQNLSVCRANLARSLSKRNAPGDREKAVTLLQRAYPR